MTFARAGDVQWGSPSFLLAGFCSSDGFASTLDQRSANEKEGDLPQTREVTCRHVSSKHTTTDNYENSCSKLIEQTFARRTSVKIAAQS